MIKIEKEPFSVYYKSCILFLVHYENRSRIKKSNLLLHKTINIYFFLFLNIISETHNRKEHLFFIYTNKKLCIHTFFIIINKFSLFVFIF